MTAIRPAMIIPTSLADQRSDGATRRPFQRPGPAQES